MKENQLLSSSRNGASISHDIEEEEEEQEESHPQRQPPRLNESFYRQQIQRRKSQVEELQNLRRIRSAGGSSPCLRRTTSSSNSSTTTVDNKTNFVELSSRAESSNWRNRIVSRYSSSMVDLGNLPFDSSSGNHNETWCMESYLVDSVRFNIHQRRERLAMELQKGNNNNTPTDAPYSNYSSSKHTATNNPFLQLFHQYSNNEIPTSPMVRKTTTSTAHSPSDHKVLSLKEGTSSTNTNSSPPRVDSISSVADFVKWNIGQRRQRMDSARELQRSMSIEQAMESFPLGNTTSNTSSNAEWEPRPIFRRASLGKERNDTTTKNEDASLGAIDETTNDF